MTPPPRKAGLYARISDDPEGLELGTTRQEDDLRADAERDGDQVVAVYSDDDIGASTRSKKPRPGYARMIEDAMAGRINRIRAYSSSRLTRRPRENEDLIELAERHGIDFRFTRSPSFDLGTADGRQVARMLAAADAAESERIGERTARALLDKANRGEFRGGRRPFGFEADGVTVREEEAQAVRQATVDLIAGTSLYEIAARWNAAGLLPTGGGRWLTTTVRQVLVRARNAGLIESKGDVVGPAQWRALVTEEELRAARVVVNDHTRRTSPGNQPAHLGSGLYRCGACEQPALRAATNRYGNRTYRCFNREHSPGTRHVTRIADPVDMVVEELLVVRLSKDDAIDLLPESSGVDTNALRHERERVEVLLAELDDDRDHDRIGRTRYLRRNAELTARLTRIDRELAAATVVSPLADLPLGTQDAMRARWYGTVPDRSDGLSLMRRRAILRLILTVTIEPMGKGRRPNPNPTTLADLGIAIDWKI